MSLNKTKRKGGKVATANTGATFTVTMFPDRFAASLRDQENCTRAGLLAILTDPPVASTKNGLPYLKLASFDGTVTGNNCFRHDAAVVTVYGIEGDYDNGGDGISIEDAAERLAAHGVDAILYETPTADAAIGKHKFRVLCLLAKPIGGSEEEMKAARARQVSRLQGLLGADVPLDGVSWNLSQSHIYGRVKGTLERKVISVIGTPIDLLVNVPEIGKANGKGNGATHGGAPVGGFEWFTQQTDTVLRQIILDGSPGMHQSTVVLSMRLANRMDREAADAELRDLTTRSAADEDRRQDRLYELDGIIDSAYSKVEASAEKAQEEVEEEVGGRDAEVYEELNAMHGDALGEAWPRRLRLVSPVMLDRIIEEILKPRLKVGPRAVKAQLKHLAAERRRKSLAARREYKTSQGLTPVLVPPTGDGLLPVSVAEEVEAAILASKVKAFEPYNFGGLLSRVTLEALPYTQSIDGEDAEPPPVPCVQALDKTAAQKLIESVVTFERKGPDETTEPLGTPTLLPQMLLSLPDSRVPRLSGTLAHPLVLRDGRVIHEPGLDFDTGLLLAPGQELGSVRPYTQKEATAALTRIGSTLLNGFEFATRDDYWQALGFLFTGVERRAMDLAPAAVLTAAVQSSGKTTLARAIHVTLTGQDMPVVPLSESPEEQRKAVMALLLRNPAMLCFDNLLDGMTLESPIFAKVLTSTRFTDRLLGEHKEVSAPTDTLIVATGNNVQLGSDEVSRWLVSRLTSSNARPYERRFDHPDMLGWARSQRAGVLRDVLGVVAGYVKAGGTVPRPSRFVQWDALVRGPILWAGGADLADQFRRNEALSPTAQGAEMVLRALAAGFAERVTPKPLAKGQPAPMFDVPPIKPGQRRTAEFSAPDIAEKLEARLGYAASPLARDLAHGFGLLRVKRVDNVLSLGRALTALEDRICPLSGLVLRKRVLMGRRTYLVEATTGTIGDGQP